MRRIHKLIIQDVIQSHELYQFQKATTRGDRVQYLTSKDTIESTIKKELKFNYQMNEIYIHQEITIPSNPKPYHRYTYCKYQLNVIITNIYLNNTQTYKKEKAIKALQLLLEEVDIHNLDYEIGDIQLSIRTHNCMQNEGIIYIKDLLEYTIDDLKKMKNMGSKTIKELQSMLHDNFNLKLEGEL